MKKLLGAIFNRHVLTLLGLILLALLIWLVGPLIAIAEFRPLDPRWVRITLIAAAFAIYLGRLLWRWLQNRKKNAQLMDGLLAAHAPAGPDTQGPGAEEVALLRQRFEEAVGVLKQSRLGGQKRQSPLSALFGSLTQRYVYELPWYVFIGAPGSGKTTALVNAGLKFPLADKFGQNAIRGIGGTRNCDWWFTDEAVLLDTAGRYTTQESNQSADAAAWQGFLALLKKFRPRRPINGVMLTVSVTDLLQQNAMQREQHAAVLRTRIQELYGELGVRFPIYVLVTKADLLAGFMQFFGELGAEERAQVWGVTFPYHEEPAADPTAALGNDLTALERRLNDRLIDRLEQERDPQRRAQLYLFPQQFAMIRHLLTDFLQSVFAPSSYEIPPLPRGVYFTSGTQEGSPIDRVMGALGRSFKLESRLLPAQRPSGKSFFLSRLIRDVLFAESQLAGTNLRWERRRAMLALAGFAAAGLITAGMLSAWGISYSRNSSYLADVAARLPAVRQRVQAIAVPGTPDVLPLMPPLTELRHVADTPEFMAAKPPLSFGWGLYQGDKLDTAADIAYRHLLRDAMLPKLGLRLETLLRSSGESHADLLYEALKAYLMLTDAEHFDGADFKAFVEADWDENLPHDVSSDDRDQLRAHLAALLENGQPQYPLPLDKALVASTRSSIAQTPISRRIYNRIRRAGLGTDLPEFTIAQAAGPAAALAFSRQSGQPLTRGVPGLFSVEGYKRFKKASEEVTAQLATEEGWVLGSPGKADKVRDAKEEAALLGEVRRLYLEDYGNTWDAFVKDIHVVSGGGRKQSLQTVSLLSAPDSPLPKLLRAIVEQVTLVKKQDEQKTLVEKGEDRFKETTKTLRKLVGEDKPAATLDTASSAQTLVDDRFDGLRRLVTPSAPGQPAPIDATTALLKELYAQMTAADAAIQGGNAPPPSDVANKAKVEAGLAPEPVRGMLLVLSDAAASQALSGVKENISQLMGANIGDFCSKAIAGRYPFVKGSARDVTQDDFAHLFAQGGLLDDFFQKNLLTLVDTSTRPWSYRQLSDRKMSDSTGALAQFQRAQAIRDVFFRGGGRGAAMRLDFKPIEMDASITQFILDVDGQLVKYSHGPQVIMPVQWPGPRGSTQVRLQLSPPLANGSSGQVYEGPWALFRMFDKVQIEPSGQPEKFIAVFNVDGRKARFEVATGSVQNPFRLRELDQFQCPERL
ncbi:type VI secretion system membrane subunit TssM [Chitinivorax sp. PXF-14]|uniref:type VI secretion system membrane subunit TssM n=1 Tax=Chitinivorax sp. PXF-14 TaxID=3230488 RepID=UPI003466C605